MIAGVGLLLLLLLLLLFIDGLLLEDADAANVAGDHVVETGAGALHLRRLLLLLLLRLLLLLLLAVVDKVLVLVVVAVVDVVGVVGGEVVVGQLVGELLRVGLWTVGHRHEHVRVVICAKQMK